MFGNAVMAYPVPFKMPYHSRLLVDRVRKRCEKLYFRVYTKYAHKMAE